MPTLLAAFLIGGGLLVLGGLVAAAFCATAFGYLGLRDLIGGTSREGH